MDSLVTISIVISNVVTIFTAFFVANRNQVKQAVLLEKRLSTMSTLIAILLKHNNIDYRGHDLELSERIE